VFFLWLACLLHIYNGIRESSDDCSKQMSLLHIRTMSSNRDFMKKKKKKTKKTDDDDDGRLSIAVWAAASCVLVMSDCFSMSLYASSKWAFVVLGIVVLSSLPLRSRA
jgi:hypothetical protein